MFEFTIIASGTRPHAIDFEDRFFEAGCDDATITLQNGTVILDFMRKAATLEAAIESALADVERAGARVASVRFDETKLTADDRGT